MKVCKYCGTTDIKDFIFPSGKEMRSVCVKCNSKNKSLSKLGQNNPMFGRTGNKNPAWDPNIVHSGEYKCKHCGTTNKEDFEQPSGRYLRLSCHKCYSNILSKQKKKNNPMKKLENRLKTSSSLFNILYYKNTHPFFCIIEDIRDNPDKTLGNSNIQVKCKLCNKWFTPTNNQLTGRIRSLEHPNGNDGSYFYCSNECKNKCPLYGLIPTSNTDEKLYSESQRQIFRQEVLKRQFSELGYNECEICGSRELLEVHHEKPQKTHPHMSLDPDNGIILCKKNNCHMSYGHRDDCSTGILAIKECI